MILGMVSAERMNELYEIDLVKGEFYHKRSVGCAVMGSRAGYSLDGGYRILSIDRKDYFEHNLIWFLTRGSWPPKGKEVDHKNRIKSDSSPNNLRLASRSQNCANSGVRKDNKCGHRGVHFNKEKQKYAVQITKDKKVYSLGYFKELSVAAKIAQEARIRLFGEFAEEPIQAGGPNG
jgi:hypothetical protein